MRERADESVHVLCLALSIYSINMHTQKSAHAEVRESESL